MLREIILTYKFTIIYAIIEKYVNICILNLTYRKEEK